MREKLVRQLSDIELLKELSIIEKAQTERMTRQIKGLNILGNSESNASEGDINFEEKKMANSAYDFNDLVNRADYVKVPYLPQLIALV
ncbi:9803_t:CDS:2 [Funneliformis geosporum]|uniref:9803_t:CDS:1 n=1 Tax=Funneliformis geosporum TaxID=1117311 RepID=A0A9W4ST39_9GLOM|nr:9803_t:CDS:2 [Funneliformis geosporum]